MTEISRFFDGGGYTEAQWNEYHNKIMKNDGYLSGILDELEPVQSTPAAMSVDISSGEAWVRGAFYQNTAAKTMTIEAADPSNPRIDRVVLRCSWSANSVILAVLKGTAAASPSAPSLTQSDSTWEISLCQVAVAAGATSIVTANITDQRLTSSCGVGACNLGIVHINTDGTLDAGSLKINNVADPGSAQDAATKAYADTKAALASPAFTGIPTAPTAAALDYVSHPTQIATIGFVSIGMPVTAGASDALLKSEPTTYGTTSGTPVKVTSITVPSRYVAGSTFRVKIYLALVTGSGTAYCEIRSEDSGLLTTFTNSTNPWVAQSADLAIPVSGDKFEVWIYATGGLQAAVKNFGVYGTTMPIVTW